MLKAFRKTMGLIGFIISLGICSIPFGFFFGFPGMIICGLMLFKR